MGNKGIGEKGISIQGQFNDTKFMKGMKKTE
jgi:hypothetical protein